MPGALGARPSAAIRWGSEAGTLWVPMRSHSTKNVLPDSGFSSEPATSSGEGATTLMMAHLYKNNNPGLTPGGSYPTVKTRGLYAAGWSLTKSPYAVSPGNAAP